MIDLIYDCDITMGLPGKDVDDGLALLYLLGSAKIRILGITTTFGNSTIEEVHPCLLSILKDLGRSDIPACRGAPHPGQTSGRGSKPRDSEAARFLADIVCQNPGFVAFVDQFSENRAPAAGDPADSDDNSWRINLPKQIRDMAAYWRTLFDGWRRAGEAWPQ